MMNGRTLLLTTITGLSVSGCFTGIESTPKITSDDVKRQQIVESAEERFLTSIAPEPWEKWQNGKLFYVTDNKINVALEPGAADYPKSGEYIEYNCFSTVPSVTGSMDTELLFTTQQGKKVRYKVAASPEELAGRKKIEIPFTIETSIVDSTREALSGKTLFIRTSTWYDDDGRAHHGRKFVPVKITDVMPGNTVYPVMLRLVDDADRPFCLFMSVGDSSHSARDFASLFYFDDPRKRYPQITDETWTNIINGRVARYMTREECRLALGAPASIDRRPGISSMHELWSYENGRYLVFEDGLLQSYRN